ncbi:hypothetical protein CDG55_02785 [Acinetobacter sp. WCHA45]|nr:hypothetical protein CDG55_02785 [Acinetobacter sp. WCHA45]
MILNVFQGLENKGFKNIQNIETLANYQTVYTTSSSFVFLYFTCKQARDKAQDKHLVITKCVYELKFIRN